MNLHDNNCAKRLGLRQSSAAFVFANRKSQIAYRKSSAAFSLIEVMCAILILGFALAALTHGLSTALASSKDSEVQTSASLIAAGIIETLRADSLGIEDGDTEGDCDEDVSQYRWKQSITPTDLSGLHEVKVTIQNATTGNPVYELKTLLFDPNSIPKDELKKGKDAKSKKKEGRKK